jgi:hypothetical protein
MDFTGRDGAFIANSISITERFQRKRDVTPTKRDLGSARMYFMINVPGRSG